jgi:putative transposase
MPRRPLIYVPDLSVHVFPRGINGGAIVHDDDDRSHLLHAIVKSANENGTEINSFSLMTTHYHLIVTPTSDTSLEKTMQSIGISHTRFFNRKYGRTGTLWNERYGAASLEDERYFYNCLRYVDLNAFRAHMVAAPDDWTWCSYRFHALGQPCEFLTPHPLYIRLGATAKGRQEAYRALCSIPLTDAEIDEQRHPPRIAILQLPVGT